MPSCWPTSCRSTARRCGPFWRISTAARRPTTRWPTWPWTSLSCQDPTSIFHSRRLDYDSIVELIPPGASVLDLGCGNGGLLARLRRRGCRNIMGIELDEKAILACVRRGLDVVQADLDHGLSAFADGQFDFVVLSQTLQAVMDVQGVLKEILRVGRQGIISFPNIGYWKLRKHLYEEGRAPRAGSLLGYHWYNSPNVRFLSIADFEDFCRENKIKIHQQIALDTEAGCKVYDDPNLNADMAIVVISTVKNCHAPKPIRFHRRPRPRRARLRRRHGHRDLPAPRLHQPLVRRAVPLGPEADRDDPSRLLRGRGRRADDQHLRRPTAGPGEIRPGGQGPRNQPRRRGHRPAGGRRGRAAGARGRIDRPPGHATAVGRDASRR